jgi:choline dehydrogenase
VIKHHRGAGRGKPLARSYDYVIVGAGSADCVVARRLVDGTNAPSIMIGEFASRLLVAG